MSHHKERKELPPLTGGVWDRIMERARALNQGPAPPGYQLSRAPQCLRCHDAGLVRVPTLDENGKEVGSDTIECVACLPKRRWRRYKTLWPPEPDFVALSRRKVEPLDDPAFADMLRAARGLVTHWPAGALLVLAGVAHPAYGTGKTHVMARIWRAAWKSGRVAVYVRGPMLQRVLTNFGREQAVVEQRVAAGDLAPEPTTLVDYRTAIASLGQADVLLLDELSKITTKGGTGWTENQISELVEQVRAQGGLVVIGTNDLGALPPSILNRSYHKEVGARIVDLSQVPSWRTRPNQKDVWWIESHQP